MIMSFCTGFYCDNTFSAVSALNDSYCPMGYYCPAGTGYATEYPCYPGTVNNMTHRTHPSECQDCPGGFYCESYGLVVPDGPCSPGYVVNCRTQARLFRYVHEYDDRIFEN